MYAYITALYLCDQVIINFHTLGISGAFAKAQVQRNL